MRASKLEHEAHDVASARREAGLWLRELRESRRLSQRQLAERVGLDYYTFVSQIEAGRGRIPAERYRQWADALDLDPAFFVRNLLRFYEPATFDILFGGADRPASSSPSPLPPMGARAPVAQVIPLRP